MREPSFDAEKPPWVDGLDVIQKIVFADGVRKIPARAFLNCLRLEQIEIPASVTTIGGEAFTICYCGDKSVNGGKNVFWCLEDGVLILKKNPAADGDNFSTGFASWRQVTKNIKSVKVERGIVPNQNFFEWLGQLNSSVPVSF